MAGFISNLFKKQSKSIVTSSVKSDIKKEDDPWEQKVVVQNKEGLKKLTEAATDIAIHEHIGSVGPEGRVA